MILLDTHIWIWWIEGNPKLTEFQRQQILKHQKGGLGVSVISIWEVAQLVSGGKLALQYSILWLRLLVN